MKILFEEYLYDKKLLTDTLDDNLIWMIKTSRTEDDKGKMSFVGYIYSHKIKDVVFVLPKVFVEYNTSGELLAFGKFKPEDVYDMSDEQNIIKKDYPKFDRLIYELSTWLFQSVNRYMKEISDSENTLEDELQNIVSSGGKDSQTSLEIISQLAEFARKHRNLLAFQTILSNSGYRKIHWGKTIGRETPVMQKRRPVYLKFRTKKDTPNFNEELIVLFFSVMRYLNKKYCFSIPVDFNYELIPENRIETLIETGMGERKMLSIRKNYFVTEFVQMWRLLHNFFKKSYEMESNKTSDEYLIVKKYNAVFENMIEKLIGDENIAHDLKHNPDGKELDHIYRYKSAFPDKDIYYIGDSKYYGDENELGRVSRNKQFTYAKNIIQYNINLFYDSDSDEKMRDEYIEYRDELTRGYNITPNFFIRGNVQFDKLDANDVRLTKKGEPDIIFHFKNQIFDHDTLLTQEYNINFLFVLSYYVREYEDAGMRDKIRKLLRHNFIELVNSRYKFYIMKPDPIFDGPEKIKENFYSLMGKVFRPFNVKQDCYILGLDRKCGIENENIMNLVKNFFHLYEYSLGSDPLFSRYEGGPDMKNLSSVGESPDIDNEEDTLWLVGYCKDKDHREWIEKQRMYNVRYDNRRGSVKNLIGHVTSPKKLALYDESDKIIAVYRLCGLSKHKDETSMAETGYPASHPGMKAAYVVYTVAGQIESHLIGKEVPRSIFVSDNAGSPAFIEQKKLLKLLTSK